MLSALGRPTVCLESDASGAVAWLRRGVAAPMASVEVGTANIAFGYRGKSDDTCSLSGSVLRAQLHEQTNTYCFSVNNSTVVSILLSGFCRNQQVLRLIRLLHFVAAELKFTLTSEHIPGTENIVADHLLQNLMTPVFDVCPQLSNGSDQVPESHLALLEYSAGDWTSSRWKLSFSIVCIRHRYQHDQGLPN